MYRSYNPYRPSSTRRTYKPSYKPAYRPAYKPAYRKPYSSAYKPAYRPAYRPAQAPAKRYKAATGSVWDQIERAVPTVDKPKNYTRVMYTKTENITVVAGTPFRMAFSCANPSQVTPHGGAAFGFPQTLGVHSRYYVSGAKFTLKFLAGEIPVQVSTLTESLHPNLKNEILVQNPKCVTGLVPETSTESYNTTMTYSAKNFYNLPIPQNPSVIGSIQNPPTATAAFFVIFAAIASPGASVELTVHYEVDYCLSLGGPTDISNALADIEM